MAEQNSDGVAERSSLPRRLARLPAEIIVAVFVIIDGVVSPLFRPAMRFLSRLRLIRRLEAGIAALPPYLILCLLVVPFGVAELAKVYAVILMAEEHFRIGVTIFIGAYVVSILICERIFHAGKSQLMTIGWFRRAFEWLMAVKAHLLAWFRQTRVWGFAQECRRRTAEIFRQIQRRLQMLLGFGPKRSF